ncbi:MAG: sulfite exporter TauE/SafE family protein [Oscillospiraceae bacterium]|nr:sulfite exporter TauE/SafE family protein [Oscillospiraceae bacterium]
MDWLYSLLAGAVSGVVTGLGIGGGTLLMLYMTGPGNIAQHMAQGINLLYFMPSASGALFSHIKDKRIDWQAVWPSVISGVSVGCGTAFLAQGVQAVWLRKIFGVGVVLIGLREMLQKRE